MAADMFHLPCGCMAIDREASYMSLMPGFIPSSMPHGSPGMGWFEFELDFAREMTSTRSQIMVHTSAYRSGYCC